MTRKRFFALVAALMMVVMVLSSCGSKGGENGEVRVYCFGDYIDPELIGEFEAETGIKVIMDTFDTNEEMYPVVSNRSVNYDVICCSDYMIEKLISEDALYDFSSGEFGPLSSMENYGNLDSKYLTIAEACDPGNKYAVPHTYGTLGILYNTENIAEGEITSWKDLWKEEYSQKIVMPDSMRDTFAIALKAKGYSINTTNEAELKEATEYLEEQKPLVYTYANDSARDLAIGNSADLVVVWNGEVLYSQEENENLEFVIPKEGTEEFMDFWAVPSYAQNVENAMKWINFMLSEDAALRNFDYLTYSIPNKAVIDEVSSDQKQMSYLFPEEGVLSKCETLKSLGPDNDDMYSQYWKEFKAS
ncbi:MAG: ABC transporter substrate-binding protein [Firmicutes bacterium]|nr:ABC transporter substrate-binding protein [Bacillota bacterium]